MADKFFGRPISDKRAYYEFGKYISERAAFSKVDDTLKELGKELEGTSFPVPQKSQASKLRKTYELYVKTFGFPIDRLENISALDLYRAQTPAYDIVKTQEDAEVLINRLNSGEDFNHICKEYNLAPKTAPEYLIEKIASYISGADRQDLLNEAKTLTMKYWDLIRSERGNPAEADKLFLEYNKAIIDLIARVSSKSD